MGICTSRSTPLGCTCYIIIFKVLTFFLNECRSKTTTVLYHHGCRGGCMVSGKGVHMYKDVEFALLM